MKLSSASIIMIGLVVVPVTYMLLDRTPPYIRHSGEILSTDPAECKIEPSPDIGRIAPGACVVVKWNIEVLRACTPSTSWHVGRSIEDAQGRHELQRTRNIYGGDNGKEFANPLIRPFVLPAFSVPGKAIYRSTACFSCNPLQTLFWPICISEPSISYNVEASAVKP